MKNEYVLVWTTLYYGASKIQAVTPYKKKTVLLIYIAKMSGEINISISNLKLSKRYNHSYRELCGPLLNIAGIRSLK